MHAMLGMALPVKDAVLWPSFNEADRLLDYKCLRIRLFRPD